MKITKPHLFYFNSKRYLSWLCLLSCLFFGNAVKAKENETSKNLDISSNSLNLGSTETFLKKLKLKNKAIKLKEVLGTQAKSTQLPMKFNLIDIQGAGIPVITKQFSLELDGYLSMEGQVAGFDNSEFIFQGNNENLYGWMILQSKYRL